MQVSAEGHFILILVTLDKLLKKFFQMLYMILKIWLCYLRMDQVQIQLSGRGSVGFYGKIRNISPSFFSEALFLPAVKHTVVALKQDFLDVMLDKTSLDESTLTDLLTVQIMGCLKCAENI